MKKVLATIAAFFALGAGILMASPLSLITGPQSAPFAALASVNSLINSINANIASFITFANSSAEASEMAFSSSASFVSEGATTCGFSAASFQKCLVIVLNDGTVGFIGVQTH
jgi:hypothetical protein